MDGWKILNEEFGKIQNQMVVAYLKAVSQHFSGGTEETHKKSARIRVL
jgi:hypothetical protein